MFGFSLKNFLLSLCLLSIPVFIYLFFSHYADWSGWSGPKGKSTLYSGRDFRVEEGGKKLSAIPDSEMLSSFDRLKGGFQSLDFSLSSETAFAADSIPKNVKEETGNKEKKEDKPDNKALTTSYDIGDVSVTTDYRESKNHTLDGFSPVKQTITLKNRANTERTIDFSNRIKISASEVIWDGNPYQITEEPKLFQAYDKTASVPEFAKDIGATDTEGIDAFANYTQTYAVGMSLTFEVDGHPALYDWSDALALHPEIKVYKTKEGSFIEFLVKQVTVPAQGETIIDPSFGLNDTSAFDIQYEGDGALPGLTSSRIAIGDVNGDGVKDLVTGSSTASYGDLASSGSAFVIFGTLIDDVGATTGNNQPLTTSANYNIRYDGIGLSSRLTHGIGILIGDINGDSLPDLVLGGSPITFSGTSNAGNVSVIFSTLIDDVGVTTGNNLSLGTAANYNIRYDGLAGSSVLTVAAIGDVNSDSFPDLVLGASGASFSAGRAYVLFSTLIDDVGVTTGNNISLATTTNYNILYSGSSVSRLTAGGIVIGDVNGDSYPDLVLGAPSSSGTGSAYVIFSTLIDDVGATTGNSKALGTGTNYNIRYDGDAAGNTLTSSGIVIGDVNGDSYPDLVLGENLGDNNGASSGSAYVMFSTLIDDVGVATGNNQALSTGTYYNIRYDGAAASDQLTSGSVVGNVPTGLAIGDINGDSYPDLVLGAPNAANNGATSGSAYVMFSTLIDDVGATTGNSKALGTGTNYNIRYDGDAAGNTLTSSGIVIGDVNGDSYPDLVLGENLGDNNGASSGSAYVMFSTLIDDVGAATGNNQSLATGTNYNIRYDGAATNAGSPSSIFISNVNGDSYPDLIFGSSLSDNNGGDSGSAYVMFSTLIDDVVTTGNNQPLSTGGNYNIRYDGYSAIISLTNSSLITGDINGDSIGDLVIGAPTASFVDGSAGAVFVIFGGTSIATGNNKLFTVAANYNIRYDGTSGDQLALGPLDANSWWMMKNIFIGDLNNDSHPDLVLGAYTADNNGTDSGSVYVMFSTLIDDVGTSTGNVKPLSTSTSYNVRFDGAAAGDVLTYGSLSIGDLNGDSANDLVIGAPPADNNGANSGSAYVILNSIIVAGGATTGNNLPLSTSTNYNARFDGEASNAVTSGGIAIGDINGDSLPDLVLGAPTTDYNSLSNSGSAYVIFNAIVVAGGATTGNNLPLTSGGANYNIRYDGTNTSDEVTLGGDMAIGDINGDSYPDLVLGSYSAYDTLTSEGSVFVIFSTLIDDYGATTGTNTRLRGVNNNYNIRYDGNVSSARLSLGGIYIRDLNGDSFPDLILGAPHNGGGSTGGYAYVIFSTLIDDVGETTGNIRYLTNSAYYNVRFDGVVATDSLTLGGIAIGDVNGDSLPDMVLGAPNTDFTGTNAGSAYVVFNSRIVAGGATTGNTVSFATAANYDLRYDGFTGNQITNLGNNIISDINDDSVSDLILGGALSNTFGSVWAIFGDSNIGVVPDYYLRGTFNLQGSVSFQ